MSRQADSAGRPRRAVPVRIRLLAIALLPTLVVVPLLLAATMVRWNEKFDALLQSKVHGDLTIAHQYFARILETTGDHLQSLGLSALFQRQLGDAQKTELTTLLEERREALGFDFLYLLDADRRLVASARPIAAGDTGTAGPVLDAALAGGTRTSVDLFTSQQLEAISPELAARARIELVPTPNAAASDRREETQGLVVHAAAAVPWPDGRTGALVAGILLNQNLVFIDTINDLVYRENSLPDGSVGTATLFLDDVRISTNVRLFEGKRALGTRVSKAVREAVLDQGKVWLGSAFVVDDWYMSAYEPISDSHGARVGMLYVGFLERPFTRSKQITLIAVALAFLAVAGASVPIFLRWAGSVFKPLERMDETIARVEAGERDARTALAYTDDELGRVARNLDRLLGQLAERERELVGWNETLNRKVDERTRALELANREIEATTRQLIMSEKLAAVGEITAGVAHEINNPIAVIQGNLDVLRELVGRSGEGRTEFRLIDEQIMRVSEIVGRLLQFARPEEYAGAADRHGPAEVIADCLPLVRHLLDRSAVTVRCEDRASRLVLMNRTELQQVLVNLIVNAIHAMPDGGELTLRAYDMEREDREGIGIDVEDTGTGMTAEVMARIFDPFFTTKAGRGNGLGLSITRKLVTRQGGEIAVRSIPGEGTTFTVFLPEAS
ncbi:cache domain-containing protein [Ancylobacter sp. Lp-2]|uniref:sensor histidine kinase n=1 Tax=Ancylobacter sp. Lp-2 TaxID=2881339 RepID=UPI001E469A44|nr:cache domain-containing protein [Ancylobacter sp. Lp-2]MCB4770421.1 cache domain-containing protein [Ancylobacter sp. Lp-2]